VELFGNPEHGAIIASQVHDARLDDEIAEYIYAEVIDWR
jgi:hypothetical protein